MNLPMRGEHPNFTFEKREGDPECSSRLRELIKIWDVNHSDIEELIRVARNMEIDNETESWDCQEWVIDVLSKLVEDCVIGFFDDNDDEDDEKKFKEVMKKIRNLRGPD
jgi:hypothetical protein